MTIQNARSKATLKKAKGIMNQQAPVPVQQNGNGVHDMEAPVKENSGAPAAPALGGPGIDLVQLRQRHEKMTQGLNQLKAQRDDLEKNLSDVNEGILRTEGAIVMLVNIIQENSAQPQAAA